MLRSADMAWVNHPKYGFFDTTSPALPHVKPSVELFLLFVWFMLGIHSKVSHWGSYDVLVCWYCMSRTMSASKININLCADFVPTQTLWVFVPVCSGVQCVSGSGPAPAPLSLCVFVCADLFQQCSFGQALGASSLSAPVWTQKPLTTFDSVNILAPFNMQPEVLCKDEEWGGWWEGTEGEGLRMSGGCEFLGFDIDFIKQLLIYFI